MTKTVKTALIAAVALAATATFASASTGIDASTLSTNERAQLEFVLSQGTPAEIAGTINRLSM